MSFTRVRPFRRIALAGLFVAATAAAQFVDVTTPSGLEAIVDARYDADPDWWLSGLHFVDLDADGALDLFLSAHTGGSVAARNDGAGTSARRLHQHPIRPARTHHGLSDDAPRLGRVFPRLVRPNATRVRGVG